MKPSRPRWKLLGLLLAIPIIARIGFSFTNYQEIGWGGAATILMVILLLVMALIWLLLLSGLRWKQRLVGLVVLALLGVGLRFSVRHEGHMGDFFPQFAWVWSPTPDEMADSLNIEAR